MIRQFASALAAIIGAAGAPGGTAAFAAPLAPGGAAAGAPAVRWVGTWASAQVRAAASGLSATGFTDQTVRDIVHTSAGGRRIRISLSNAFGAAPLAVGDVHVALRRQGAATVPGTTRQVTFHDSRQVVIPPGGREVSDPVRLDVGAGTDLAVSLYFRQPTGPATWHPDAVSTSYYSGRGDHSADTSAHSYSGRDMSWFFLDGVDVVNPAVRGAVVAFGPSTTDGSGSTPDANERYPDDLASRLLGLPYGERMSVLNAGISGNQLLADAGTSGQSAVRRFYRDAIDRSGVRAVIIWEGTNDIGHHPDLSVAAITGAYQRLIRQAHVHGLTVIGATLQPDEGAGYYTAKGNALREAVNDWIRDGGAFDGVADFAAVLRDPGDPDRLLPGYDSGDHLHPNDAGYRAIAGAVNLAALTGPGRRGSGVPGFGLPHNLHP